MTPEKKGRATLTVRCAPVGRWTTGSTKCPPLVQQRGETAGVPQKRGTLNSWGCGDLSGRKEALYDEASMVLVVAAPCELGRT